MKNGYKIIDMDTHVGPSFDVLGVYVEPSFRPKLQEMEQYKQKGGKNIAVAPYQWSIAELKGMIREKWLAGVWLMLPEGMPIDDPDLDPLYDVLNDYHLPIVDHSFTSEPPFWPGYRDVWDNPVMVRTASHPWRAARWLTYLIIGRVFDRFPNVNAVVAEVGQGWLPHWVTRLDAMIDYVASDTVPPLNYKAVEYVKMGRFVCPCEHFEGPELTKACYDLLGDNCWAFQSDYPHPEACFPDTAELIIDWPIWNELGDEALHKHMHGNAERILRLI